MGRRRGRLGRRRAASSRCGASPARATVYRPDIGGLLPVYVADRYEGVEARPFQDLSEEEVEDYVERNVAAVREVVARARPDVALANHLVMGPLILARALGGEVPYAVKIHGSALEYTVKPLPALHAVRAGGHPRRARACSSARATRRRACGRRWPSPGWRRARGSARPAWTSARSRRASPPRRPPGMAGLAERLGAMAPERGDAAPPSTATRAEAAAALRALDPRARPDRRLRRQADRLQGRRAAARRLPARARARARRAAARRRLRRVPGGPGGARGRARARRPRRGPRGARARTGRSCRIWRRSSTRSTPERYAALARATAGKVHWAGRLEHEELTDVLPAADGLRDAEHVPRGVRDGRRRGRRLRRAAGRRRALRDGRGRPLAGGGRRPGGRPWLTFAGRPGGGGGARGRARELARGAGRAARAHARGDRRGGA